MTPAGNTVRVIADYQQNIPESNEQNNIWEQVWTAPATLPDLIVERIECSPENKLLVTITNIGSAGLSANWVAVGAIFFDGASKGTFNLNSPTSRLDGGVEQAGGSSIYLLGIDITMNVTVRIIADSTNGITEANEQNNLKEEKLTPETTGLPDLIIEKIEFDQTKNQIGYTVTNIGQASAPGGHLAILSIDGTEVSRDAIQVELLPNKSTQIWLPYTLNQQTVNARVCADSLNQVKESNEQNNCRVMTFQPGVTKPPANLPDLMVQAITYDQKSGNITCSIKNIGEESAPPGFTVTLMVNNQLVYDKSEVQATLKSGESSDLLFKMPALPASPTVLVKACVDYHGTVKESDETNNCLDRTLSFPVPVLPVRNLPDLVITNVWISGDRVCYWMKNVGDGTAEFVSYSGAAAAPVYPVNCLLINGDIVCQDRFPLPLLPGDEIERCFTCPLGELPADYTITVCADCSNLITESDDDNNCRDLDITPAVELNEEPCGCFENDQFPARITGYDGFAVGNVVGDFRAEIVTAVDEDASGDLGRFHIYDGGGRELGFFDAVFTRNDRIAIGDVWGDSEYEEIVVASDDRDTVYIYRGDTSGTPSGAVSVPLRTFTAAFAPYDCLAVGNVTGDARDEIIIGANVENKIYVYTPEGARLLEFTIPWDFGGSYNIGSKTYNNHALVVGDVFDDEHDEIILLRGYGDQSRVFVYSVDSVLGAPVAATARQLVIVLKMHFAIRYTFYDGFAVGNVLGDEKKEIIVAIDEDHAFYIYDALGRWLKLRYGRITPVDGLACGNVSRGPRDEIILAIDEDHKIYVASEDPKD